jgi:ribosomal protein L22
MADEIKNKENKVENKEIKKTANETKVTEAPLSKEPQEIIQDKVEEAKKPEIKKVEVAKKEEAITKGTNLHASMRQCMYICKFIKNKSIDDAIKDLEDVILYKQIVPFKGEIPHRKGKIMSGRYPINVSKLFIPILKTLKGNVLVNKMDLDKTRIYFASACYASRPSKKGGGRFKRANLVLKAKEAAK